VTHSQPADKKRMFRIP